jgi:hypothetical protein
VAAKQPGEGLPCLRDDISARLTIEVDGKRHADQVENDRERRAKIESAGYLEIRSRTKMYAGTPLG